MVKSQKQHLRNNSKYIFYLFLIFNFSIGYDRRNNVNNISNNFKLYTQFLFC